MIKAAIFDLDGTIADTLDSIATATNKVLKQLGFQPQPISSYKYFAGDGASTLVERALIAAGDEQLVHFEEAYEQYKIFFAKDCTYKVEHFEGMKEVLDRLKEKGILLAVLTNKPHDRAIQVVDYLFGKDYFEIVLGEVAERKRKPDPEGAYFLAEQLGVTPNECMYLGDTNVDMKTGKAAGMYTVGVLWGFREKEELVEFGADAIIEKPEEMLQFV